MTPKEKAEELVNNFTDTIFNSGCTVSKPMIKKCALIVAINIIITINDMEDPSIFIDGECQDNIEYWQQVKTEIENL